MSSWSGGSFRVRKDDAEKFIRQRMTKKRDSDAPEIDYGKMQKGPEQIKHPKFHGPLSTNTLAGEE